MTTGPRQFSCAKRQGGARGTTQAAVRGETSFPARRDCRKPCFCLTSSVR